MFFLNKSVQLLLLLVLLSQGQGAPSHGDQLAAEEDEEIEDSEDNLKVFEADEQKTQEEIDSTPGAAEDDDAMGSVDITEDTSGTTTQSSSVEPASQVEGEETTNFAEGSSNNDTAAVTDESVQQEIVSEQDSNGAPKGEVQDVQESGEPKEDSTTQGSANGGVEAPELESADEGEVATKSEELAGQSEAEAVEVDEELPTQATSAASSGTSGSEENSIKNQSGHSSRPEYDDSNPNNENAETTIDNSDSSNDGSGKSGEETDDYMQVIEQVIKQDFTKATAATTEQDDTWESTLHEEGSLYSESNSEEPLGIDSELEQEDQQKQHQTEEVEENDEEPEESRSLLSRWWLWLVMLCLVIGLGLLCKARMSANKGEAQYLRMGERHQGSTITIPR